MPKQGMERAIDEGQLNAAMEKEMKDIHSPMPIILPYFIFIWFFVVNVYWREEMIFGAALNGSVDALMHVATIVAIGAFLLWSNVMNYVIARRIDSTDTPAHRVLLVTVVAVFLSVGIHLARIFFHIPYGIRLSADIFAVLATIIGSGKMAAIDEKFVVGMVQKSYTLKKFKASIDIIKQKAKEERLKRDKTYADLKRAHNELTSKNEEFERLNKLLVNRELAMVDMKRSGSKPGKSE